MFTSKAISSVVATAMFILIIVGGYVVLQNSLYTLSTNLNTEYDAKTNEEFGTSEVKQLSQDGILYFKNSLDTSLEIQDVKVEGTLCSISEPSLETGVVEINISSCLDSYSKGFIEVALLTNRGVFSREVYYDKDTISSPSMPTLDWNITFDGGNQDRGFGLALDSSQNVYITGHSNNGTINNFHTIKYNSAGSEILNVTYGGSSSRFARDIKVSPSGNIYTVGHTIDNANDYHIVKHNSLGIYQWNVSYSSPSSDLLFAIDIDSSENLYATGNFNGDILTIKLNSSGNQIWNTTFDSGSTENAQGIAVDSSGNVYVAGYVSNDQLLIKYNSSGNQIWNITFDESFGDYFYDISTDSSNNIYTTGSVLIDFQNALRVYKYDTLGNPLWNTTFDNPATSDKGYSIALDSSNNVYVTGQSNSDIITIKLDSSGNYLWNETFDSGSIDNGRGIVIDSSNNVYVVGENNDDMITLRYSQ